MTAVDTSSLVAFLAGEAGARDVMLIREAIAKETLLLPAVVVTEALSNPMNAETFRAAAAGLRIISIKPGYWERAGASRATLRKHGLKAALADTLIAQACIDADVALITRDKDFRHFEKHCGLKLA